MTVYQRAAGVMSDDMATVTLFDHEAALAPLVAHSGLRGTATCGRCCQTVHGVAGLTARGFIVHPNECPPAPRVAPRPGELF